MSRLRQVPKAEASAEVRAIYQEFFGERDPVAEPGTATGTPGDYWTTFALVPDLMVQARDCLLGMLGPDRQLDPQLRELAILRTGIVGDSRFEYSQHMKVARTVNIPEDKLAAIKGWTTSGLFSPAERAVMAATDELLARNLVEDATFAELQAPPVGPADSGAVLRHRSVAHARPHHPRPASGVRHGYDRTDARGAGAAGRGLALRPDGGTPGPAAGRPSRGALRVNGQSAPRLWPVPGLAGRAVAVPAAYR